SRRRHTRCYRDWSSDVCSSDLGDPDSAPVDDQMIAVRSDFAAVEPVNAIVLEQPRIGTGLREIVDADEFETAFGPLENCSRHQSDRKSTRLNSSHGSISYAVFC